MVGCSTGRTVCEDGRFGGETELKKKEEHDLRRFDSDREHGDLEDTGQDDDVEWQELAHG